MRIAVVGPLEPITPAVDKSASQLAADLIFEGLLTLNEQGDPSPSLARAWHLLPAGHVWIELDTQRCFSDGSRVTLDDITASLKVAGFSVTPNHGGLDVAPRARGVPAELELTRTAIFKPTSGGFLGSGAFIVVHQDAERLVLERAQRVPHRIARVEFRAYPSDRAALAAVLKGECNAHVLLGAGPLELVSGLPTLQVVRSRSVHSTAIVFNHKRVTAADRKSLLRALRAADLESIIAGNAPQPGALTPVFGFGAPLSVLTWNADRATHRVALAVRALLGRRAGPFLELAPPAATSAFTAGRFDFVVAPVRTWPPAEALALWRTGVSFAVTGYSNPALDAAVDARDWAAAKQAFELDPPGLFLGQRERLVAVDARIKQARLGRTGLFDLLPSWEIP